MKVGSAADNVGLVLEPVTVGGDRVLKRVDGREVLSDKRLVGEGPQRLSGLQLRRVGRQEDEMDALRHLELGAGVVARLIEHQDNASARAGADRFGEGVEDRAHHRGIDAGGELPFIASRRGMHEGEHIEPLAALLHARATGRLPLRAQTVRRIGLSPTRCSSVAQTCISASGYAC